MHYTPERLPALKRESKTDNLGSVIVKMGSGRPARVTAAPTDIEKILALARKHSIASQFGVTGGGNDGAVFLRHGASNLAIGWPLRYSHTPAEVVD